MTLRFTTRRSGLAFLLSAAFLAALIPSLVTPVAAQGLGANEESAYLARARAHNRMLHKKKRGNSLECIFLGECDTTTTTSTTTSAAASTTSSGDFWDSLTGLFGNSQSSTTTDSSTSSLPTTTSLSTSSFTPNATTTTAFNTTSSATPTTTSTSTTITSPPSVGTSTAFVEASASTTTTSTPTPDANASGAAAANLTVARKTVVILVAIGGSIGLIFLIWTGIRKWKFRPSSRFEDRIDPTLNWAPSNSGFDASDPADRLAHRRNGSNGSNGSFGSSEMAHNNGYNQGQGMQQQSGYGATSYGATAAPSVQRSLSGRTAASNPGATYDQQALPPLPAHDFTAGANGGDAYDFYHNNGQNAYGTSGSPPTMVENGLTRGATQARPVSMNAEDPYGGLEDDFDSRPALPPHHGGAYHTGY
ncbi:hypothetical protein DL93DRAFT_2162542 [Clavulina sp. PMI_390]|nr:hypothetical protein DL93DRAFT_2162542 [Clavulina sp. PMI_390]